MAKDVDLSSREWCDLIFEGKNKEFGAYQLRTESVKRHNKAVIFSFIGLLLAGALIFATVQIQTMIEEAQLKDQAQQQTAQFDFGSEEQSEEEEQQEAYKEEEKQPEPEVQEVAQQQVTELKIVPDDKVTSPPPTQDEVKENEANIGTKNIEGQLAGLNQVIPTEAPKPAAVVETKVQVEEKKEEEKVFTSVEQMPQFPGGDAALLKYLSSHMQYPAMAAEQGIEGKVILQFVVTKSGQVGEVKVVRPLSPECDREATRVVKSLPKFTPGRQNGNAVNCWYTLPVTFKLQK